MGLCEFRLTRESFMIVVLKTALGQRPLRLRKNAYEFIILVIFLINVDENLFSSVRTKVENIEPEPGSFFQKASLFTCWQSTWRFSPCAVSFVNLRITQIWFLGTHCHVNWGGKSCPVWVAPSPGCCPGLYKGVSSKRHSLPSASWAWSPCDQLLQALADVDRNTWKEVASSENDSLTRILVLWGDWNVAGLMADYFV